MTLGTLVTYAGIVLGFWLIAVVTSLAVGRRHGAVLRLGAQQEDRARWRAPRRTSWVGRLRHARGHR